MHGLRMATSDPDLAVLEASETGAAMTLVGLL